MRDFDTWVKINYIIYLEDGSVYDDHCATETITVPLGARAVPKPLENALFEMEIGEEREVIVTAADGFGPYKEEAVIEVPSVLVPHPEDLPIGEYILWQGEKRKNLSPVMAKVVSIDEFRLILDLNHPLAGKDIKFWAKIVEEGQNNVTEVDEMLADLKAKVDIEIAKEKAEAESANLVD